MLTILAYIKDYNPTLLVIIIIIIIIIIFIYRGFTTSAQPDITCRLFKTYLPKGPQLLVGLHFIY